LQIFIPSFGILNASHQFSFILQQYTQESNLQE
jgi:hypothetical protein